MTIGTFIYPVYSIFGSSILLVCSSFLLRYLLVISALLLANLFMFKFGPVFFSSLLVTSVFEVPIPSSGLHYSCLGNRPTNTAGCILVRLSLAPFPISNGTKFWRVIQGVTSTPQSSHPRRLRDHAVWHNPNHSFCFANGYWHRKTLAPSLIEAAGTSKADVGESAIGLWQGQILY